MFNPDYILFTLVKNKIIVTVIPDSGKYNVEHLAQFSFIGRMITKAIYDF